MTVDEGTRAVLEALRAVINRHETFFTGLGIPTLAQAIDAGITTMVGDGDLRCYCRLAAGAVAGDDGGLMVAVYLGQQLVELIGGEGDDYFEVDGEPYLHTPGGDRAVTEHLVRHLLWSFTVTAEPVMAGRLLEAAAAETPASGRAARRWGLS